MGCQKIRDEFSALYSQEEKELLGKLNALFCNWNEALAKYRKDNKDFAENNDYKEIVPDGFYPKYLSQKTKILFLGRESYTIEGRNYIDLFTECYLTGIVGKGTSASSINTAKFHKMLIKVAWGILNNKSWNDIPQANKLCGENFFDKLSFAFMNLSKLSNTLLTQKTTQTNWSLFDHAVDMSLNCGRNFILDEIKLLDPDLIITMNLGRHRLKKVFGEMLEFEDNDWWKYKVKFPEKDKKCLLIDSWHFSSTKKEKEEIYDPILKIWQDFCAEKV